MTRADIRAQLGEVVTGRKPGRRTAEEITVFDSTGMALQDAAAASVVFDMAQANGHGVRFSFTNRVS
jgi:ornithine cyclodeaminase/alanine dehydrogenase-like protein (mu-crystallin family)